MQLTGAEIVIECLKEQGVDTVFGYPGGTILNVYDALYKHADEINHILTSHEQGAAHAADGYARATGKVGVCMATSGPGATNLVTGIATAYMDSIPIVAITANVNLPALGKDSFQEVDIAGVTMPITKHGYIVKDINVLADTIRKKMFVFEDIVNLDSMAIQEFTKQVDPKDLAIAIKGSTQEVAECIFSNISTRARESLQADIEYLHNVRMRDVEAAQQNIVATIRRLEQEQIITISHGGGGDEVIA